jgi:PIN domain nuclease of toxin-antitoxin system
VIVLLDTHALLWALEDSPRLSGPARAAIEDTGNIVLASVVSGVEIAIKRSLGRLEVPDDDLQEAIEAMGFATRLLTFADARHLAALPPHHKDPFDRLLVAQALSDGIPVVTCDPLVARYPIQTIW